MTYRTRNFRKQVQEHKARQMEERLRVLQEGARLHEQSMAARKQKSEEVTDDAE